MRTAGQPPKPDKRETKKETTMLKMNLKAMASAAAALVLTVVLTWTFVDATSIARVHRDAGTAGFLATISALVR